MTKNEIQIAPNAFYSLQSERPIFFQIDEGSAADLFYVERLKNGFGRKLFLLRLEGPILISSFRLNQEFDLAISPQNAISLSFRDELCANQNIAENAQLVDNGILNFSNYFYSYSRSSEILSLTKGENCLAANTTYGTKEKNSIIWISGFGDAIKFLNKKVPEDTGLTFAPIATSLWFNTLETCSVTITDTNEFLKNQLADKYLNDFSNILSACFEEDYKINTAKKLKQVWSSFYFRKKSVEDGYDLLSKPVVKKSSNEVIETVKTLTANQKPVITENLLLQVCQLIGSYEQITFKAAFKTVNTTDDPLKHILRASNIRARRVILENNWWKNNHGALLAYLKEGNVPVALIPKGNSAYWIVDLENGQKTKVDAGISNALTAEAKSFFTPFPSGNIDAKGLLNFALQFTKRDIIYFIVIGIIGALLALLVPITSGYVFNTIIPGGKSSEIFQIGFVLLFTVITIGFLNFSKSLAVLRFEGKASYKLQSALWDRILSLRVPFFSLYNPGDLAERSLGIEKIRTTLSANVMGAVSSGIFSIFYLALLFFYDVQLACLALVLGLAVAIFTLTISLLAYKHVAFQRRMEAIISGFMMMVIRGISKIRLTGSKEKVFNIWADKFNQQKEHYAKKQQLIIIADIFTFTFPILASLLIYLRIYNLLTDGKSGFEIGDFIAFNSAYLFFQGALINTFMVTVPLMGIKPTYQLFKPILDAEIEDYENKADPGELNGEIEVTKLSFKYNDTSDWILRDINFKIKPGEFVALAGSSGSGKSTLYRILLGFEQYQEGSVLFDNHELKEIDIRTVRDQLGVVLQNGKIMQGTVLYNIIGTSNYTEENAWEAARMAGCDEDIRDLPLQMHTILPPGGGTLSGGQQQRIVIARALVRKPKILLFDEATSALDNETQQTVSQNIEKMRATRIVIAHRLSTIQHADRILVMDKGKIVEEGTFEELTKMNGFFQNLVKSQLA